MSIPEQEPMEDETVLNEDYPMYPTYWYVVDVKPKQNEFLHKISVGEYKRRTGSSEVRRCNAVKRNLSMWG